MNGVTPTLILPPQGGGKLLRMFIAAGFCECRGRQRRDAEYFDLINELAEDSYIVGFSQWRPVLVNLAYATTARSDFCFPAFDK
jgi:hypothetical protein